jgi:hypothetical protein
MAYCTREVTLAHEESLVVALLWAKLRYLTNLTQRPHTYADATLNSITEVADWYNAQEAELPTDSVPTLSATLNRRDWFESIQSYLAAKKDKARIPLTYVVSTTGGVIDPAGPDPGFGLPSFDEDLAQRGRHDSIFWAADNNSIWRLLELKCRGTDSWNTISGYERTRDGAQAYRALSNLYLGEDVQQVLRTKAGLTLIHSKFDGKSKSYTLDKHINAYKQAFIDLGPNDVTSEQRKVELFMNSWQVPELMHLASGVCSSPQLQDSFDSTVVYLSGEMAALKTLNVYHRTTAAVKVKTDSDNEEQPGAGIDLEEENSDPQAEEQSEEEDQEEDQD